MRLKSISSFLATILLIGFTISTGIIVYYFVSTLPRTQTQQVSSLSSQVISCSGGFFDVKNYNGIYKKPITIYPFNFVNSTDSRILTINTTNNQLSANHSFYLAKVSSLPSYASLTIYYTNLTSSSTGALFDIFVNGNKLGTLTVPSGVSSYTFTNVSINWLISNGLNNITYQNASIDLDSLQIINSTLNYNATLSNDLNDYQILITIDTASLISQGKLKNDCSDIRFLDSDDKTLLNYWIESDCNRANTKIWVKVPNIPASSTKTIYVYYGNPSANSLSNGDLVFDFFDDFLGTSLNTTKWYVVSGTSYTVSNGILKITVGAIGLQSALPFNLNSGYLTEARIQYNSNSEAQYSGVLEISSSKFTASGNGNADATILYMVNSPASSDSVLTWIGSGSTASYNIADVASVFTMALNTWYILGDESTPSTAAVWKDYSRLNNYAVSWAKNINYLSLGAFDGSGTDDIKDTSYDWVRVRKYTYPESTTSVGNEENITINLISSGNPTASMGNQFTSIIYLTNGTIIQKDFSLENNCNLGKDCVLGKSTISLNSNVPIDKIKVCSKACSLICNEYKVS